jgi:PKD repeat protein
MYSYVAKTSVAKMAGTWISYHLYRPPPPHHIHIHLTMNLHPHLRTMMISSSSVAANTAPTSCFVYGTLMSPEVLQVLLGRVPTMIPSAILPHHSRHPVIGRVYPGVIPIPPPSSSSSSSSSSSTITITTSSSSSTVEGLLILDITPLEMKILDWFESDDYKRSTVQVILPSDVNNSIMNCQSNKYSNNNNDEQQSNGQLSIQTNTYIWSLGTDTLDMSCDWDYSTFLRNHLGSFLENTVMPCRTQIEKDC